jgi:two-component system chemotaxis response regulator CheY
MADGRQRSRVRQRRESSFFQLFTLSLLGSLPYSRSRVERERSLGTRRRIPDLTRSRKAVPMALRILIVDDSDVMRRILGTILRSRHWTVCGEAENGWSGVKKFQELKPDVVLLDLAMPDINGIEAAKWMSASDPSVPLILFTILDIGGIESAAQEAGISAIVPKTEVWNLIGSIEKVVARGPNPQTN